MQAVLSTLCVQRCAALCAHLHEASASKNGSLYVNFFERNRWVLAAPRGILMCDFVSVSLIDALVSVNFV